MIFRSVQRSAMVDSQAFSVPRRVGLCAATFLSAIVLLAATPLFGQSSMAKREYEVKAAFLYHFTQFVEWPATAAPADRITLCLLGGDSFGSAIDELAGKQVGDRTLFVRRLDDVEEAGACQILFIGSSEENRLSDAMAGLAGRHVLTVGETDRFTEEGGIIRFFKVRNRLRFEVNLEAGRRAGVKISSQMLKLARIV